MNAEMDHHLSADESEGNTRNGYGRKTVMTGTGKLEIEIPRDRQSNFDLQLIAKYDPKINWPVNRSTLPKAILQSAAFRQLALSRPASAARPGP